MRYKLSGSEATPKGQVVRQVSGAATELNPSNMTEYLQTIIRNVYSSIVLNGIVGKVALPQCSPAT